MLESEKFLKTIHSNDFCLVVLYYEFENKNMRKNSIFIDQKVKLPFPSIMGINFTDVKVQHKEKYILVNLNLNFISFKTWSIYIFTKFLFSFFSMKQNSMRQLGLFSLSIISIICL